MAVEDLPAPGHVVEGDDHRVLQQPGGGPLRVAHRARPVGAPVLRVGVEARLGIVVGAVVDALALRDLGPPGVGPRALDGVHHGLGAGVGEADALQRRRAAADLLGQLDLALGRERQRHEALGLADDRLDDGRVRVAEELDRVVVDEVDPLDPVHVGDAAALGLARVDRVGRELGEAAGAAAGEHRPRPVAERGGARVRIGIGHGSTPARERGHRGGAPFLSVPQTPAVDRRHNAPIPRRRQARGGEQKRGSGASVSKVDGASEEAPRPGVEAPRGVAPRIPLWGGRVNIREGVVSCPGIHGE